jgi:hypothetical protein
MPRTSLLVLLVAPRSDNYFEFYVDGTLVQADPVSVTPHQAVAFSFDVANISAARTYAVMARDFATASGYEFTSSNNPRLGDGCLRMTFSDGTESGAHWKCYTTNFGPNDESIANGCDSQHLELCNVTLWEEPAGWTNASFDDSNWADATTWTENVRGDMFA